MLYFASFSQLIPRDEFTQYTIEDGLPSNFVYAVEQDDRGYIWIATDAGVSRFDGYEFKNYTIEDGLPDNEIINFFKDSRDRIWLYTFNGRFSYIQNDSIFNSDNTHDLEGLDESRRIVSIREWDNNIYISGSDKIKILKPDTAIVLSYPPHADFHVQPFSTNGEVYGLTHLSYRITNNYLEHIGETGLVGSPLVHWIELNSRLISHCGRSDSIVIFDPIAQSHSYRSLKNGSLILNLTKTSNKAFLLTNKAVHTIDSTDFEFVRITNVSNASNALIDNEDNLWITSLDHGLLQSKKQVIKKSPYFKKVSRLVKIKDKLYIHHDEVAVSAITSTGRMELQFESEKLRGEPIYKITPYDSSIIYLTSKDYILRGKHQYSFSLRAREFAIERDRYIQVSVNDYIASISRKEFDATIQSKRAINSDDKFQNIAIKHGGGRKLFVEKDSLWLAADEGLFLVLEDSIYDFSKKSPILKTRIWDMAFQSSDSIFLATGGSGVILKWRDSLTQITTQQGLLSNICRRLAFQDSNLWITTNKGLNKITLLKTGGYIIHSITEEHGLPSNLVHDVEWFNDTIYVGTEDGLAYFSANTNFEESNQFPLYIHEVNIDDSTISYQPKKELPHDVQTLKFGFVALNYQNVDNLIYGYRLKKNGQEGVWIETSDRQAIFTNTQPGNYQFEVRAKSKNSKWTKAAVFPLTISPPFWSTIWFQLMLVATSLSLGYLGYQRATKNRRAKAKLAADKVEAQLQALRSQINPHFLFNVLNSIKRFILRNENDAAESYLTMYSHHIRDILHFSRKLTLSIHQEITLIDRYIEIEKIRTGDSFQFDLRIEEGIDPYETFIPTMVIQPFVENAIWHGIVQKEKGIISLSFKRKGEMLRIQLKDNGIGFDSSQKQDETSLGIALVKERIQLIGEHYKSNTDLTISSQPGKGTQVTILLPIDLV